MWPKLPPMPREQIVVVPLEPPPPPAVQPEQQPAQDAAVPDENPNLIGVASWYGDEWQGRITASGKPFDDSKLTAAHRTLPLNTRVRVTNLKTGRSVEVTITDRGPYADGRVIDLSKAAAKKLGMVKDGLVPVRIESVAG
jgi:rare lipoprotein A